MYCQMCGQQYSCVTVQYTGLQGTIYSLTDMTDFFFLETELLMCYF